jgi:hypothetical protein
MLFNDALPAGKFTQHRVKTEMIMDGEKVIIHKKTVLTYLKVGLLILMDETHEKL